MLNQLHNYNFINIFQLLVPVMTYEAQINKIKRKKNLNCHRQQIKHLIAHSMAIDVKDSWLTGNDFFGEALWSNCSKLNTPTAPCLVFSHQNQMITALSHEFLKFWEVRKKIHHIVSRLKSSRENHSSILYSCDSPETVLSHLPGLFTSNTAEKFW